MIDIHFSGKKINVNYFLVHDWYTALKVKCLNSHYDQILDTHFFYIFIDDRSFLDILANFNLLVLTLEFWNFISKNLWSPLIFLVPSLGENWRK